MAPSNDYFVIALMIRPMNPRLRFVLALTIPKLALTIAGKRFHCIKIISICQKEKEGTQLVGCAPFFMGKGTRRGAVLNDVPVARQSSDRPRRAARRESSPPTPTKHKPAWLLDFSGIRCGSFFTLFQMYDRITTIHVNPQYPKVCAKQRCRL